MLIFLTGCGETKKLTGISEAAARKAVAETPDSLPELPEYCAEKLDSGVVMGESLKVTALRLNNRLGQQNKRIEFCAEWYRTLRERRSEAVQ